MKLCVMLIANGSEGWKTYAHCRFERDCKIETSNEAARSVNLFPTDNNVSISMPSMEFGISGSTGVNFTPNSARGFGTHMAETFLSSYWNKLRSKYGLVERLWLVSEAASTFKSKLAALPRNVNSFGALRIPS